MIKNVIIGSCSFSISFKGSFINISVAIIGCPGMFSEHLMPSRGVKPWLELLMQSQLICIKNFFRHKARHDHKRLVAFHIFISTQTIAVFQNDVTKCPAAGHGLK